MATETIGWIGTGTMGLPLCGHLLSAGYSLAINSRTRGKAENLLQQGAHWCETPADVTRRSTVIFTMVGKPEEVSAVYFADHGIFSGLQTNAVVVDMGTTPPSMSAEIADRATGLNAHALDAPVSGGDVGARNATLSIMVGGDEAVIERVRPMFECMSKSIAVMGGPGSGQHTKMANQLAVAGTMIGVCEALVYSAKAGLDLDRLVAAISQGAAGCWTLDNLAPDPLEPIPLCEGLGQRQPIVVVQHQRSDLENIRDAPSASLAQMHRTPQRAGPQP